MVGGVVSFAAETAMTLPLSMSRGTFSWGNLLTSTAFSAFTGAIGWMAEQRSELSQADAAESQGGGGSGEAKNEAINNVLARGSGNEVGAALADVQSPDRGLARLGDGTVGAGGNPDEPLRTPQGEREDPNPFETAPIQRGAKGIGLQLTGQTIIGGSLNVALVRDANGYWNFTAGASFRWGMDCNLSLSANGIYAPNALAADMTGWNVETGLDLQVVGGAVSGPPLTTQTMIPRLSYGPVAFGQYFAVGYSFSVSDLFSFIIQ
jgi:hypothetical protein